MKKKPIQQEIPVTDFIESLFDGWLESNPNLTRPSGYSRRRMVDYELIIDSQGSLTIVFYVYHGPFNQACHEHKIRFTTLNGLQHHDIENALLHALTFEHSPFQLTKNGFRKRLQVMG